MKARNFSKFNLAVRNYHKLIGNNPDYIFFMKCACGYEILFSNSKRLSVNIESDGDVNIGYDFFTTCGCKNPMCKWSKIKCEDD